MLVVVERSVAAGQVLRIEVRISIHFARFYLWDFGFYKNMSDFTNNLAYLSN